MWFWLSSRAMTLNADVVVSRFFFDMIIQINK
jgi:hypothetical protein